MTLKRYSKEELIPIAENLVYEELLHGTKTYFLKEEIENENALEYNYKKRREFVHDIRGAITQYTEYHDTVEQDADKEVFRDSIAILKKELYALENSNMKNQKALYKKTGNIYLSRTWFEFPINKKLNSLYDDFSILAIFYDDLSTLLNGGKLEILRNITCEEEKMAFLKENIEITHLSLVSSDHNDAQISIYGTLDSNYSNSESYSYEILESKYCDFNKVTLADTMDIYNNDLRQIIQSKIDIDKENLVIADEKVVRGDLYRILEQRLEEHTMGMWVAPSKYTKHYIRYVCPSTGRVYFNELNDFTLQNSEYYNEKDPVKSYIHSWWSINNLGDDPTNEKDMIRC